MQHFYGAGSLDEALSKIDAFVRLLSYLQDVGTPDDRAANRDAEGYLLETIMQQVHCARRGAGPVANDWRCGRCALPLSRCPRRDGG